VLPTRDLQSDVLEGYAVTTHDGDMREGEQGRRDGVHSGLNGCDRFLITCRDDSVILTERGYDARDHGWRISKATTRLAGMKPGKKILMFHFETPADPGQV
jgi:hypothetical protein